MTLTTYSVPKEVEKKILTAIELKKQLEQYETEIKAELQQAMEANGIKSIKNDAYTVTLASRATFSADMSKVSSEYLKTVLDTSKCATHSKLYGELPKGVSVQTTNYISWRSR